MTAAAAAPATWLAIFSHDNVVAASGKGSCSGSNGSSSSTSSCSGGGVVVFGSRFGRIGLGESEVKKSGVTIVGFVVVVVGLQKLQSPEFLHRMKFALLRGTQSGTAGRQVNKVLKAKNKYI